MKKVRLLDKNFIHHNESRLSCDQQYMIDFTWDRYSNDNNLVVYTDSMLINVDQNIKNKIAWLLEPKNVSPQIYEWIINNEEKFDHIWTHCKYLIKRNDKYKFVPFGGCWIYENDQKIYDKTKLISIIASYKKITFGHNLRHEIIQKYSDKIQGIYGNGYNTINYKLEGLKDYMFSVCIENSKYDYFFTEKLIDCFITGTVPIYWGCPSTNKFFDTRGMIIIKDTENLKSIFNKITPELYNKMKPYIEINFQKAKNYLLTEQWIIKNNYI